MNYSRQRSIVLDIMKTHYTHPTAEEVYEIARKELPSIGIATVYRNLNQLAEAGEIIKIPQPGGVDRFDGRVEEHYHMRCPSCGKLEDLFVKEGQDMKALIALACKTFGIKEDGRIGFGSVLMEKPCEKCRKALA